MTNETEWSLGGGFSGGSEATFWAQIAKNLPAMQKTQDRSLGWADPLEKGMATDFSILA